MPVTFSFRSRPAFCISLIPKLPAYLFTPLKGVVLFRISSHLPKVCSFSAFSAHLPKVRNRPGPSVAPVPAFLFPAAFSHLPKVCSFPAFSAHLPKVRNRTGPSVASMPAFLFPAASFHLPKVRSFPAFSAHLPKVRTSIFTTIAEKCGNRYRCGRSRKGMEGRQCHSHALWRRR